MLIVDQRVPVATPLPADRSEGPDNDVVRLDLARGLERAIEVVGCELGEDHLAANGTD